MHAKSAAEGERGVLLLHLFPLIADSSQEGKKSDYIGVKILYYFPLKYRITRLQSYQQVLGRNLAENLSKSQTTKKS